MRSSANRSRSSQPSIPPLASMHSMAKDRASNSASYSATTSACGSVGGGGEHGAVSGPLLGALRPDLRVDGHAGNAADSNRLGGFVPVLQHVAVGLHRHHLYRAGGLVDDAVGHGV